MGQIFTILYNMITQPRRAQLVLADAPTNAATDAPTNAATDTPTNAATDAPTNIPTANYSSATTNATSSVTLEAALSERVSQESETSSVPKPLIPMIMSYMDLFNNTPILSEKFSDDDLTYGRLTSITEKDIELGEYKVAESELQYFNNLIKVLNRLFRISRGTI